LYYCCNITAQNVLTRVGRVSMELQLLTKYYVEMLYFWWI